MYYRMVNFVDVYIRKIKSSMIPQERMLMYGFNEEQYNFYSQNLGYCGEEDITDNEERQEESLNVLKMILDMENITYYQKLKKIKALLDTNVGFKAYLCEDFRLTV